jgi:hypothetical protein
MPFTAEEISNINNSVLENYIEKGTVFKQNVQNKPMLKAFDEARGEFTGGNQYVSLGVKSGQGGGSLTGYTHDDQVGYYNPASNRRVKYAWKEHHIGMTITHTELKIDGIDIDESGTSTSAMSGREDNVLANLLDEKNDDLGEDYAKSLDSLIHGDGTTDTKALAGIGAFILANPTTGTTGGINRALNTWWRNRAATAAHAGAGGQGAITSNVANGGALLQFLQKDLRLLGKYASGGTRWRFFCGSDFYDALETELRANGNYTQDGFMREGAVDGGMAPVKFKGKNIEWDPTLDDLSLGKRMYVIDMKRVRLLYMNGQRMKKHTPSRPYDRYVMYNGLTTTAVMVAQQLNTSAVYDIA